MTRRPRIARASGTRGSSVLLALTLGAFGVGTAAAAARARDAHPSSAPTIADGVRRLRAAVVGDVRDPADRTPAAGAAAGVGGLSRATWRALTLAGRHAPRPPTTVDVPAAGDSTHAAGAFWGPAIVWFDRTGPTLVADAGDTVALPVPALPDALPAALRERGVRWHAEGAVTLLGGGRAVLDAPGATEITAFTPIGRMRTPVTVRPVVRGRLYGLAAGDAAAAVAARVVVRQGATADTTWTDAAGCFRLVLPPDADGQADVYVEPTTPTYAPVVLRAVPAARLHTLGVVLLPTRWTITDGSFAGTTVPVRAAAARGFWQFTHAHARPVASLRDGPHTVALAPEFDAADTATFWRAARALEAAWGRPLYVPYVRATPADSADDSADVVVRAAPWLQADGLTTLGWDESGAVAGVTVTFRVRRPGALQAQVVAHELLHALGFGHARGWNSVLAPAGRTLAAAPTAADVAYGQLYDALRRQARRAEAAYGAAYGWGDAIR